MALPSNNGFRAEMRHRAKSALSCFRSALADMEMEILRHDLFDDANNQESLGSASEDQLGQDVRKRDLLIRKIKQKVAEKAFSVHAFVDKRDLRILRGLLKIMPDLMNSNDERGWKPLSLAAHEGYLEGVSYFLTKFPKYAQVCDEDGSGSFPIHRAVMRGHIDVVEELLWRCPETIHQTNSKHQTILHLAASYSQTNIVKHLGKHETELKKILDSRDADGNTFRDYLEARQR